MVQSLDLEEQEQLAQLKHFWARYGNFITWLLILVFASIAAWNGWNYWQHKQAQGASVLFDQVERAAADKDTNRLGTALTDLQGQYGRTAFAQQGALLAARGFMDAGDAAKAKQSLEWAAGQSTDEGLQAIARLRLSALTLESGSPDEAKKWLEASMPADFLGLVADRQGDIFQRAGQVNEAKQAYTKAYQLLGEETEYRRLVEVKLNALGVDPTAAPAAK